MTTAEFWMQGRTFAQYFGLSMREAGSDENGPIVEGRAHVHDHVRGSGGGVSTGALLAVADSIGGMCAGLTVVPDRWVVSTSLMLRVLRAEHVGPLRLRTWVLRAGRSSVVNAVQVFDEGALDAQIAEAVLTSAALRPEFTVPVHRRPMTVPAPTMPETNGRSLREILGIREIAGAPGDDAGATMDVGDDIRNPWGIVHGGAIAMLVDAAAQEATGAAVGDAVVHFLRPGRHGPVEARCRVLTGSEHVPRARVEVRDAGAGGRVTTLATTSALRAQRTR